MNQGIASRETLPADDLTLAEGTPRRFTDIAIGQYQALPYPPVGGHGKEYATLSFACGVQNHASVRRETR